MKYDEITLKLMGNAVLRRESPTEELLNKYSDDYNGTITNLFKMFGYMKFQRGMAILKPFVDSKYHVYVKDDDTISSACFDISSKNTMSSLSHISTSHSVRGAEGGKSAQYPSKVQPTFVNLNKEFSKVAMHSKMNSLNDHKSKTVSHRKTNDHNHNSRICVDESKFDNCTPYKMTHKKNSKMNVSEVSQQQKKTLKASNNLEEEDISYDFPCVPYEEILLATNSFDKSRILGNGGFGTVFLGDWKFEKVAIKRLSLKHDSGSHQSVSLKQTLNELNILKTYRFDRIVNLFAVSLNGEHPCLIYEFMKNGSLEDRLLLKNNTPPLSWMRRSIIAESVAKGLNFLHTFTYRGKKPMIHGDIKSANILLDSNMDAKIGDFGLAREGPNGEDTHVVISKPHGTLCYLPPEYVRNRELSIHVDIYCYGIVVLEIATGLRASDSKRGKAKRLTNFVQQYYESGNLEALRDVKAGEEKMIWFEHLVRIGQHCSSEKKKDRLLMEQVLVRFEKMREEISMFDKMRRLSVEKEPSTLPSNLTPIEIQIFYDFQKTGQSGVSPPGNRISVSPGSLRGPSVTSVQRDYHSERRPVDPIQERSTEQSISPEVSQKNIQPNDCDTPKEDNQSQAAPFPNVTLLKMQLEDHTENSVVSDVPDSVVSEGATTEE